MVGKRILEFDILRSLAVIWIIAIWHFVNYFSKDSVIGGITNNECCRTVTYIMLSLFMFLSGMFTNTKFESLNDVKGYYLKKAKRFYPLYVLATVTLYFTIPPNDMAFYSSPTQMILSLFGVASLLNQAPSTLWFMDMLLFFIIITPALTWKNNKVRKNAVMCILFVTIYIASRKMGMIDSRFVRYTPFYLIGLLMTPKAFLILCKKYGLMSFILAILMSFFGNHHILFDIAMCAFWIIWGGKVVTFISHYVDNLIMIKIIEAISYSSMCAYFFHRQIYGLGTMFGLNIFIIPILIFSLSYYIQKLYNLILK